MSRLDPREFRELFTTFDAVDKERVVFVHYKLVPGGKLSTKEAAAHIALVSSLGTIRALPYETPIKRVTDFAIRITRINEGTGDATIAYPIEFCGIKEGLAQLLWVVYFGSEYEYVDEFWVEEIDFPKLYLERVPGPKFGIEGIRNLLKVHSRPLLGVIVKPRFGVSLKVIAEKCYESLSNGADYIIDDDLIVDPENELAFAKRVPVLAEVARRASSKTETKGYFVNIGASPTRAIKYAKMAREEGGTGLLMNGITMGISTIEDLVVEEGINLPIIAHNLGIGILTRPEIHSQRKSGVSGAVIAKLCRLAGADGVQTGSSNSVWFGKEGWGLPVVSLKSPLHKIRPIFPIASGGVNIANLWNNIASLGTDVMLEAGSGILGYPSGPAKGAQALRILLQTLNQNMTNEHAHSIIMSLADRHSFIKEGLKHYHYEYREDE